MSAHLESRLREILRERHAQAATLDRSCFDRLIPAVPTDGCVEGRTRLDAAAEALDGDVIDSPSGPCVVIDRFYPSDHWHGTVRIGDVQGLSLSKAPELMLVGGQPCDS